ncbi:winged helix-turn-helix domain-containing protein [Cellulosilyticum sp. I15G10I2]|uniref:winged helix-turn-helix domain-containing protein n=1 Tax=Cellulosilyticum sp. I15G10I2 TaxID=1892843 RepID=UPI00085BB610|nr:winged helix-turn-helix domain-containing protein [Cellulosilyticum sp. I15G10I2]
MFRSYQVIRDPIHFRLMNLLRNKRLSADDLQKILNMPINEIRQHLKKLHQIGLINCDLTSPLDMCRINDSFIEDNPFFYEMALAQMNQNPLYQDDLLRLQHLTQD